MASLFISYSRRDKSFVQRLTAALTAADRDFWLDENDIPPTADWLREIEDNIAQADAIVYVLSPDSVAPSSICRREIESALRDQKRIVPLVCRDVEAAEVIEPVRALNWLFFREGDDFDAAFARLLVALDTDLDYWHEAARYLVRARQWEGRGENAGYALRGRELAEAERWLAEGAAKRPAPTPLHVRFLTASRRAAQRQQRRTIGVLSGVSVAMAALAVVALLFFNDARVQRDNSVFRQLLAGSGASLDTQPDLALLDGLEAMRDRDSVDSRTALYTALDHSAYLAAVLQDGPAATAFSGINNVAFSADGRTLLSADNQEPKGVGDQGETQITLWNVPARQPRLRFTVPYSISAAALSPDGRTVVTIDGAFVDQQGEIDLWDATTGARGGRLRGGTQLIADAHGLAFSPDGALLVTMDCVTASCTGSQVTLWDVANRAPVRHLPIDAHGNTVALAFSPDGKYLATRTCLAVLCSGDQLTLWNLATGQASFTYTAPSATDSGDIGPFAFSADGTSLAIGGCADAATGACSTGRALVFDLASGHIVGGPLFESAGAISEIALSPDGQTLITAGEAQTLRLWNVATKFSVQLFGHTDAVGDLAYSPDGAYFASGGGDNKVLLWRAAAYTPLSQILGASFDGSSTAAFSPDGRTLATGNCHTQITLWDTATGAPRVLGKSLDLGVGGCVDRLAFSPDGARLAASFGAGNVIVDLATRQSLVLTASEAAFYGGAHGVMSFSPDGRALVAGDYSGDLAVWDAHTGDALRRFPPASNDQTSAGAAFSPDGSVLALGLYGGGVRLVNGHDFSTVANLHGPAAPATSWIVQVAFSPDGKTLAALGSTGLITLWRVATRTPIGAFEALATNDITAPLSASLAFSPDGAALAANLGRAYGLWYTATREPIIAPQRADRTVSGLAFSPDGRLLAEAQSYGPLLVRYASPALWQARACAIANRNFTHAEWRQVFDGNPYQVVCPNVPAPPAA